MNRYFSIAGLLLITSCGPQKADTLKNLNRDPLVKIETISQDRFNFSAKLCTAPLERVTRITRFLFAIDNSGSTWSITENGITYPGTDDKCERRFESLLKYLDTLNILTDAEKERFEFGLVLFNDEESGGLLNNESGNAQGEIMDRVYKAQGKSFVGLTDFKTIVQSIYKACEDSRGTTAFPRKPGWTDYEVALREVKSILTRTVLGDDAQGDPTVSNRVFYMVNFITDGAPIVSAPLCQESKKGDSPCASTGSGNNKSYYIKSDLIRSRTQSIVDLASMYPGNILGVQLNSVFFTSSNETTDPANCDRSGVGLSACPRRLLKSLSDLGKGAFFAVKGSEAVPYDQFQPPSFTVSSTMVNYFLLNKNLKWENRHLIRSESGDGLRVAEMDLVNTRRALAPFSGVSDLVLARLPENRLESCLSETQSSSAVRWAAQDSDNDGLNDLEERCLGSDPNNHDSNRDSIPDFIALWNVLSINQGNAASLDTDLDGIANLQEIRAMTPPTIPNAELLGLSQVQNYQKSLGFEEFTEGGKTVQRQCYQIDAYGIPYFQKNDEIELTWEECSNSTVGSCEFKRRVYLVE